MRQKEPRAESDPYKEWNEAILLGDEWANSLSHGVGLFLSLVGFSFLLLIALESSEWSRKISLIVYGVTLVLLYTTSTLYHSFRTQKIKLLFRKLDHCAIYLLIAGTYTPFTLLPLKGFWGWLLFGMVWGLAALGIVFKLFYVHRFKRLSTMIYLFMGWLILIAAEPLMNNLPYGGIIWLVAGGASYTFGVIFFLLDTRRFFHAIWHLFVMGGSACHYCAILWYV